MRICKNLKAASNTLCRIRHSIPKEYYNSLYFALFESHLSYCITIWGGAAKNSMDKLFVSQKHCIRVLFGDLEKYLDKFNTAARVRPLRLQKLGKEFFKKENSKPIFNKEKILNVYNIYNYQCCLEIFKILKFKRPYNIYKKFNLSTIIPQNRLLLPKEITYEFITYGSKIWNMAVEILSLGKIQELIIGKFKNDLKVYLIKIQELNEFNEWCPLNFEFNFIR